MSQEGYDKLVAELLQLESVELPQVREAIAEARDKGDLSENFEYHAAKREQSRLLGRIRFKQKVLENARVIDTSRLGSDAVGLLSKVVNFLIVWQKEQKKKRCILKKNVLKYLNKF